VDGSGQGTVSVLVVEDEPDLIELYEIYLRDEFDVRAATSGTEALELIDDTIDIVLLDRGLPGMSGDEVLEELRARGYRIPVGMVTGAEPDADIVEYPFDEYLIKPVDRDSLVETVRLLANRASFERKSRDLFRLASKKRSLEAESTIEEDVRSDLVGRIATVEAELDDTITGLLEDSPGIAPRSTLADSEIETLLSEVSRHTLPPDVSDLVEEYQNLKDARPPFMWKWVHRLAPQNTLPCVDREFEETVPVDKTITILFVTLLDDVLEKRNDRATFEEIAKIPFGHQRADPTAESVDTEYVRFARRVWETLLDRLRQAPKYDVYEDLLRFDMKQTIRSIEYTEVAIRRPDLATMGDLERYESHNMAMFVYADIDLMHSAPEMREELSTLRDVIWTAQLMSRIGNWVSTWERELREGDYCSGPVVYALENGIISRSEFHEATTNDEPLDEFIERIKRHSVEETFLTRWEQQYYRLQDYNEKLTTVDLGGFIDGTEEVLRYHLATRGLK